MKIKKMLMCVAAGAVVMSCASANDIDVNQIRTACQSSDKTLWVERNQVCIPRNPCENQKFYHYCNRVFGNVETQGVGYRILIDLYARAHNLSCKPVNQDAKLFGQDYVVCDGIDVMVFEFDDIHDHAINNIDYLSRMTKALCTAVDGQKVGGDWTGKCMTSKERCQNINDVLNEYGFAATWSSRSGASYYENSKICEILIITKDGGYMGDMQF
jgi:hypothetical protein